MSEQEVAELREQIRQEERERVEAELAAQREREAELREEVRAEVEAELREQQARRAELVEFAEGVCGGEAGLAASPESVVEFLESLPGEAEAAAREILRAGVVEFRERGSSRDGEQKLRAVPEDYQAGLRQWVESGQPVADFFSAVAPELGEAGEYDLSEWAE